MQNQNAKTIGLTIVWNNLPPKNIAKPSMINFSKIIVIMPLGCKNTAKRIKKWNEKGINNERKNTISVSIANDFEFEDHRVR